MSSGLGKIIGKGSFGKVYEFDDDRVVKYIQPSPDGLNDYIEPYILLNLSHNCVMKAFDIYVNPNYLLKILMEKGIDIQKIEIKDKTYFFEHVKNGITYLHKNCILHGDIKPANIIFCGEKYKITDFSFSILMSQNPEKIGRIIYSGKYRPPEVFHKKVFFESDIWAFGTMMKEYLSKKECEKRHIVSMTRYKPKDRPVFFPRKTYIDNSTSKKTRTIFLKKLRNKNPGISCPKEYCLFEEKFSVNNRFVIDIKPLSVIEKV